MINIIVGIITIVLAILLFYALIKRSKPKNFGAIFFFDECNYDYEEFDFLDDALLFCEEDIDFTVDNGLTWTTAEIYDLDKGSIVWAKYND